VKDLAIRLENRPGALAEMGEALGRAGVSVEGGGAFVVDGEGIAHFLLRIQLQRARLSKIRESQCWLRKKFWCKD
jgi:hypothetical protein